MCPIYCADIHTCYVILLVEGQEIDEIGNFVFVLLQIVRPVCCLVVVDVQNDFISGSLAISKCPAKHNGEEVVEPINRLLDTVEFDCVYYSLDWHPDNHVSFYDNVALRKLHSSSSVKTPEEAKLFDTVIFEGPPKMEQKLWPRHCVQNTWGAKIHENIKIVEGSPFIYKGTNPEVDSYSAFFDNQKLAKTSLDMELMNKGVTDVFLCGIAYDVCVGLTALDAIGLGYRTILVDDASRGITLEDIVMMKNKVEEGHGLVVQSDEVGGWDFNADCVTSSILIYIILKICIFLSD